VVEWQLRLIEPALEHAAGMHGTQFGVAAVGGQHAHGTRGGAEGADNYAAVPDRVRAEEAWGSAAVRAASWSASVTPSFERATRLGLWRIHPNTIAFAVRN
jgi:hypothetical protein